MYYLCEYIAPFVFLVSVNIINTMASPSKFGALHETPIKSNTEMKLITSPQK